MKAAGAVLVDPADIPHVGEYDDSENAVLLYELKATSIAISRRQARRSRR
jgi:hypothetical protein